MSFRIRVHRPVRPGRRRPTRGAYAAVRSPPRVGLAIPIALGIALAVGGFEIAFGDRTGIADDGMMLAAAPAVAAAAEAASADLSDAAAGAADDLTAREPLAVAPETGGFERAAVRPTAGDGALVPGEVLQLASGTSAAVVDLASYQMYVYRELDGRPTKVAEYRVSIGENGAFKEREGDKRTPVGVYFIESYLPGDRLPDLYGAGAFPVNYPNLWDHRLGRTGSGIWVHGTEKGVVNRPPQSSRGCVTLANDDFDQFKEQVAIGSSAVIFTAGAHWRTAAEAAAEREALRRAFEGWRSAWQSRDTERYLAYYARDFRSGLKSFQQWAAHKRRVNKAKDFIEVEVGQVSFFRYPGHADLVLVDFAQDYRSSNYQTSTHKRQYWRRDEDAWRIVHEDSVR